MDRRAVVVLVAVLVAAVPSGASPPLPAETAAAELEPVDPAGATRVASAVADADGRLVGVASSRMAPGPVGRLGIADDQLDRTGAVRVGPDLGAALAAGSGGLLIRYGELLVRERYHTADSRLARQRLLARELDAIAARADRLHRLEREALDRYATGAISGQELLLALARVDAEATRLQAHVETVEVLAAGLPSDSLVERAAAVGVRVTTLAGPVRGRIGAALSGLDSPARVHVEASEDALVLGVLENGTYVREATRFDHRDDAAPDPPLTVAAASQRAIDSYPRAFNSSMSSNIDVIGDDVFEVVVHHDRGIVTGYVDGSTGLVFREHQRQRLRALPTRRIATVGSPEVRLVVERTRPGGPLRVILANESRTTRIESLGDVAPAARPGVPPGSALDGGVVLVGNETVGRTGPDGTLWLVEPRGPYTLTAVYGATTVNVTIDPRLALARVEPPDSAGPPTPADSAPRTGQAGS